MSLTLIKHSNLLGVKLDPIEAETQGGIALCSEEARLQSERHKTGIVVLVPEKTLFPMRRKEIAIDPPVKVGDRVLLTSDAGVSSTEDENGDRITFVRIREIIGVLEP